jgi:hypothetical protein
MFLENLIQEHHIKFQDSNLFNRNPYPSALDADEFIKDNLQAEEEVNYFQWSPLFFGTILVYQIIIFCYMRRLWNLYFNRRCSSSQ